MASPQEVPPQAQVMQALFGFTVTKCLSAVAVHNVADALRDGALYYADLARVTGTDQKAMHRVMRMLSGVGIFAEVEPGKFGLTPASELLRSDVPGSMRDMAVMITSKSHWLPLGRMEDTLKSGISGPQHEFGTDLFSWFQQEANRGQWEIFNAAMTSFSAGSSHAVTESFDFSGFRHIVDIGGGHGYFLKTILEEASGAKGTLFDLPGVVEGVDTNRLGDDIKLVGGDFFKEVPAGGDCYTLKHIIHDWSDEQCITILSNVAKAMHPGGRVLLAEMVMPESSEPHPAKFMDVLMLAMSEGGCERTEKEYAELFGEAGLKLVTIHQTPSPISIVEAAKA